jgi:hypothetical protein
MMIRLLQLSPAARAQLAGDPLELLAVDGPTNEAKGDEDACVGRRASLRRQSRPGPSHIGTHRAELTPNAGRRRRRRDAHVAIS